MSDQQPPYGPPEPRGAGQPGQNPYQPYQPSPYAPGAGWGAPDHPQATTVLILGVLGIALCQVMAPIAWFLGTKALREIDAAPQQYGGRSQVNVGRILGLVGTILLALYVVGALIYVVAVIALIGSSSA
jgi:hypothetical protein